MVVPTSPLHSDVAFSLLLNASLTSSLRFHFRLSLDAVLHYTTDPLHSSNNSLVVVLTDSPTPETRLGGFSSIFGAHVLSISWSPGVVILALSSLLEPLHCTVLHPVRVFDAPVAPTGELTVVERSIVVAVVSWSMDLDVILVLSEDLIVICLLKV